MGEVFENLSRMTKNLDNSSHDGKIHYGEETWKCSETQASYHDWRAGILSATAILAGLSTIAASVAVASISSFIGVSEDVTGGVLKAMSNMGQMGEGYKLYSESALTMLNASKQTLDRALNQCSQVLIEQLRNQKEMLRFMNEINRSLKEICSSR